MPTTSTGASGSRWRSSTRCSRPTFYSRLQGPLRAEQSGLERDLVETAHEPRLMDPAQLTQQPHHALVLGQNDKTELLDPVLTGDVRQQTQQPGPDTLPLHLVDNGHGDLRRIRPGCHVGARNAEDVLPAVGPVCRGYQGEALVVVDAGKAAGHHFGKVLEGREEPEVHAALDIRLNASWSRGSSSARIGRTCTIV